RLRRERADLPRRVGAPPRARPPRRAPRPGGAPRGRIRPGPRLRVRGLRGRCRGGRPAAERALRHVGAPPRLRGFPGGDPDARVSSCAIVLGGTPTSLIPLTTRVRRATFASAGAAPGYGDPSTSTCPRCPGVGPTARGPCDC